MKLSLIAAVALNDVIGLDNTIPWKLSADLKFFKNTTIHHGIVVGRKTFESFGERIPPERWIFVITNNKDYKPKIMDVSKLAQVIFVNSFTQALSAAEERNIDELFVAGGATIYQIALKEEFAPIDSIYLTKVNAKPNGDTFFSLPEKWLEVETLITQEKDEKNNFSFVIKKLMKT